MLKCIFARRTCYSTNHTNLIGRNREIVTQKRSCAGSSIGRGSWLCLTRYSSVKRRLSRRLNKVNVLIPSNTIKMQSDNHTFSNY